MAAAAWPLGTALAQGSRCWALEERRGCELAAEFCQDGLCVIEDAVPEEALAAVARAALAEYRAARELAGALRGPELGVGVKSGFRELVQRQLGRFEFQLGPEAREALDALPVGPVLDVAARVLGGPPALASCSLVVSEPGAMDQAWHVDGPHQRVDKHLGCHVLNAFLPLVDVERNMGPTQFRPASHLLTRDLARQFMLAWAAKQLRPVHAPLLKRGSALLFDYRVLHRGLANTSHGPRPLLVLTLAQPWFRDIANFPKNSLYDEDTSSSTNVDDQHQQQQQ
jgi:ectoine hydroxylase-related dioxygenase (phytanoyl-CoA dioxygenase family)